MAADGRVWVAEALDDAVAAYPADLRTVKGPQPVVTLSGPDVGMPHGITFDADGAWVPCYRGTVIRFGPDHLDGSQNGAPDLILS